MSKLEELQKKYNITEDEAEMLQYQTDYHNYSNDTEVLDSLIEMAILQQNLQRLGFEPTLRGCDKLASCIPQATRHNYPESVVDAAMLYMR